MTSLTSPLVRLCFVVSILHFCVTLSTEMTNSVVEEVSGSPSSAEESPGKPKEELIVLANRFGTVQKNHPSEECKNGTWQEVAEEIICVTNSPPRTKRKPGRRPG